MKWNDKGLVARVKLGDKKAFKELVMKYQHKIFMIAFGILKNEEDAYDVTQEVFMKIYKYVENFQENSTFYTWVYRIAYNVSLDIYRKRKSDSAVEYGETLKHNEYADAVHHKIDSPSQKVLNQELSVQMEEALNMLSEEHRAILVMREFEELSYDEISEIIGVPKGTVMSRIHHARSHLKEIMESYN